MNVRLKIKEVREKEGMSLSKLEEETGIERHRLVDIENGKVEFGKILFIEMLVISLGLGKEITELYELEHLELKGIGEI